MITPNYEKAIKEAGLLLSKFDITEPVIPVDEITQKEGIIIKYFRPNRDTELSGISGFYDSKSNVIYVNADDTPTRQSFTIAHELGHFKLGHKPNEFDVLYRFATTIDKNPIEQEANCFAANLLVPEKMLEEVMKKYKLTENDQLLADIFGVSLEVIKYRLKWIKINC